MYVVRYLDGRTPQTSLRLHIHQHIRCHFSIVCFSRGQWDHRCSSRGPFENLLTSVSKIFCDLLIRFCCDALILFASSLFLFCYSCCFCCCYAPQCRSSFSRRLTFSELSTLALRDIFRRLGPATWLSLKEFVELLEGHSALQPWRRNEAKVASSACICATLGA